MQASELINEMIPSLKLSDTTAHALVWMDEFRCNQLPVVHKGQFLGLISEDLILDQESEVSYIKDVELECRNCRVNSSAHFFEIIKIASSNDIELIGVVNGEDEFVGVITIKDTISALSQTLAVQAKGAILIISLKSIDYSLSEISRIVELEGYKILSSSIKNDEANSEKIKLTLKVNSEDVSRLVATFERFDFKVISQLQNKEDGESDKERLDILFKYLDI
ncbi:MAG: CBS domain-containing protein [Cyclobacteriaceae bacterium]|nr:CBS domain-containing protein [Cyclobacteriaceae bacterium]